MKRGFTMPKPEHPQLKTKLLQQLQLFQEIYHATQSLAAVCAAEMPDQKQLNELLTKRQHLINETTEIQQLAFVPREEEINPIDLKNIQIEIRSVLQQTATLDKIAGTALQRTQDTVKNELFRLQAEKKAGVAYTNTTPQSEGFFLDSRKN